MHKSQMKYPFGIIKIYGIYDVNRAAAILGTNRFTLLKYIREGKIKAAKIGREYRITGDSILAYLGSPTVLRMQPSDLAELNK